MNDKFRAVIFDSIYDTGNRVTLKPEECLEGRLINQMVEETIQSSGSNFDYKGHINTVKNRIHRLTGKKYSEYRATGDDASIAAKSLLVCSRFLRGDPHFFSNIRPNPRKGSMEIRATFGTSPKALQGIADSLSLKLSDFRLMLLAGLQDTELTQCIKLFEAVAYFNSSTLPDSSQLFKIKSKGLSDDIVPTYSESLEVLQSIPDSPVQKTLDIDLIMSITAIEIENQLLAKKYLFELLTGPNNDLPTIHEPEARFNIHNNEDGYEYYLNSQYVQGDGCENDPEYGFLIRVLNKLTRENYTTKEVEKAILYAEEYPNLVTGGKDNQLPLSLQQAALILCFIRTDKIEIDVYVPGQTGNKAKAITAVKKLKAGMPLMEIPTIIQDYWFKRHEMVAAMISGLDAELVEYMKVELMEAEHAIRMLKQCSLEESQKAICKRYLPIIKGNYEDSRAQGDLERDVALI